MNIGIISQSREANITGINRVTLGTLTELLKIDTNNQYYFVGKTNWLGIALESIPTLVDVEKPIKLNYTLMAYPLDIVHSHYRAFNLNQTIPCGKILTIHDLIPLIYPQWYGSQYSYFNESLRECAKRVDTIIAVSEYTKKDIIEHYGVKEEKIEVVYNGLYPEKLFDKAMLGREVEALKNTRFLLSVSGVGPHKNQVNLVEAFLLYKQRNVDSDVKLVLTGPIRQYQVVREIMEKYSDVAESVVFTGFVSDEELLWLYQKALAFIYVSLYEGFGLPILEALSVQKATICSNTTSMPEVGGNAVEYCNPHEVESIAQAINHVVSDEQYRHELERRALVQAGKFSYRKAAEQTMRIYRRFEK